MTVTVTDVVAGAMATATVTATSLAGGRCAALSAAVDTMES